MEKIIFELEITDAKGLTGEQIWDSLWEKCTDLFETEDNFRLNWSMKEEN